MKIPKKLIADKNIKSFIVDENGKDALLTYSSDANYPDFRNEVIKRYNGYNLLKCYVVVLVLLELILTLALWNQN